MVKPVGSKILETNRFILRPFKHDDANMMYYFYLSDPLVCKYLEFSHYSSISAVSKTLNMYISLYSNLYYFHWAIVDKRNGYVIGSTSIHNVNINNSSGELGIVISRMYWKYGVGKEILNRIITYAKEEIQIKNIFAFYISENKNSENLLNSIEMIRYPSLDKYIYKNGIKYQVNCMKLIK